MVDEANTAVDKGTRYDEFSEQVLDEISKRGDKKDQVSEGATWVTSAKKAWAISSSSQINIANLPSAESCGRNAKESTFRASLMRRLSSARRSLSLSPA
jgi:hypothetical protein